ncbi:enoyl-CoA hydratase-related protein [Minwuia thermotolerans]|uniref:2-(1,2-epoxy-1,2-dihydrophenyl)acetyl-CoA isomerase n=1 Tax=Minwuia thermotolerans TaxID=2056226 RepID=A0A2M9G3T1_9PROT|nr:enoyl-CoA hydratase-related protein [Minwuia thermotolerans]PJK30375.1 2-(1,2-epoxy-1,2-dihydrophenyl)acetyl-CoA isomerase [Minwuia thermotolerans]
MDLDFEHILYEAKDGVGWITLNRPDRLNAFAPSMPLEIMAAVRAAGGDAAVRALAITGAGRGFCAGADLAGGAARPAEGERDAGRLLEIAYNPMIRAMRDCPKPIVALVNGPCAGAGMSLALACDIVIAAKSAVFLQAFCNIGLVPDAGSTWYLPRSAGRARALGMALLGDKVTAEEAADWGMIWRAVDDDALMGEGGEVLRKLANGPTRGLGLIRRAVHESFEQGLDRQLDLERDSQRIAGSTKDFAEGVTAFLEKRPPRFTGG